MGKNKGIEKKKEKKSALQCAAHVASGIDRFLSVILAIVMLAIFAYGALGLWDVYQVYSNAKVSKEIMQFRPAVNEAGPNPSLKDLQKINADVIGWLMVEDTNIDYPVVQGEDNLEYVNKSVEGKFELSGSVFVDYRNEKDFSDFYSVIYAHHMEGNSMFGVLPKYKENKFFEEHRNAWIGLPEDTYALELFACLQTDAYNEDVYNPTKHSSDEQKQQFIQYIKENALQYKEIGLQKEDQIVALSTCYDETTNGRIVVFGRLKQKR